VKPAATMAIFIACSWNSGTPSVLPSTAASSFLGKGDRLLALPAAQIGMHHVALDRPRADDRHLDDEIVEAARFEPRQHGHLRPAFDLEHAEVSAGRSCRRRPVFGGIVSEASVSRRP
jgi:hypothetical protein